MSKETELATENRENEILLIEMARYLLKRKVLIIVLTLSVMLLTSGLVLMVPNRYSSSASLLPSGSISKVQKFGKLAGFLGNNISAENSSELYPVILSSRLIQEAILSKQYQFINLEKTINLTLPEYFESDNYDQQRRSLSSITKIKTDSKTGTIHLSVETIYPGLSQAVLGAYLSELENYNLYKRNSQGQRNAQYLENQLQQNEAELTKAENRLELYRLANQNWNLTADPTILKESQRLRRQVNILSQTYLNLLRQHETARQEANNDQPIVNILDRSSLPTLKSGPARSITVLLSGMATFFVTVFILLASAVFKYKTKIENNIYYKSLDDEISKTVAPGRRIFRIISKTKKKELSSVEL